MWSAIPVLFLVLLDVLSVSASVEVAVSRHHGGDLFSNCGGCGAEAAPALGLACRCQCLPSHHTYREDIGRCVKDLGECRLAAFVRPRSLMEQIPLVFLPLTGQLVHPGAHLSLSGAASVEPLWCRVNRTQYLSPGGWKDASSSPLFSLYQDGNRTFVQWLGDERARWNLQHKLLLVRVLCTDEHGALFEPCVAFRAGWAPGVTTAAEKRPTDYTTVGLCLGVLGLLYVLAVLVFLKIRRNASKGDADHNEGTEQPQPSTRPPSTRQSQLTSAVCGATTDVVPVDHRDFLVINPQLLEPEMLASPPPPAQEFLAKIREMISVARARMRNFRFRPTLVDIPEDDYYYYKDFNDRGRIHENPIFANNEASRSTFLPNECYRVTAVDSTIPVKLPPRPPRRKKQRSDPEEKEEARFEGFRDDLYEKLRKIREMQDGPSYENVVTPPPRPPPRVPRFDEHDSIEKDSLNSPTDSLNSRGERSLSLPPDCDTLRTIDQPVRTIVLSERSVRGNLECPKASLRGFDATEALGSNVEFVHVCRRDSLGESSYESDSPVSSEASPSSSVSDANYDPDYSDPVAEPVTSRPKRKLRSRGDRSARSDNADVTIIEVGDGAEDVLNGKGNFVTLIELETSEAST